MASAESIETLAREIDRRKTDRAREATMEEKLLDGPRLFRMSCEAMKAGLRLDHPNSDEAEIHRLLIERVYGSQTR